MMEAVKATQLTPEQKTQIVTVLTDSFARMDLFLIYIFRNNKARLRGMMDFFVTYYEKGNGDIFFAEDEKGKVCATALWSPPGMKDFNFNDIRRYHMVPELIKGLFIIGLPALFRLLKYTALMDKYHYHGTHAFLFMLASSQKGGGKLLMESCVAYYKDYTLYLESGVCKNDHAYYKQFGFEMIGREMFNGGDIAFFLKKKENDNASAE